VSSGFRSDVHQTSALLIPHCGAGGGLLAVLGFGTKGLAFVRQMLYRFSHTPNMSLLFFTFPILLKI
jgi:hypothetical protein